VRQAARPRGRHVRIGSVDLDPSPFQSIPVHSSPSESVQSIRVRPCSGPSVRVIEPPRMSQGRDPHPSGSPAGSAPARHNPPAADSVARPAQRAGSPHRRRLASARFCPAHGLLDLFLYLFFPQGKTLFFPQVRAGGGGTAARLPRRALSRTRRPESLRRGAARAQRRAVRALSRSDTVANGRGVS
jgi:hypothetical protein